MAADAVVERNKVTARPLLHVLAGPNRGAEAPLDAGDWVIGAGAEADLTFSEPGLAEKHVRISIASSGARLAAFAEGVRVGPSTLAAGEECDLPLLCPVAIGGTIFVIGAAGSDWAAAEAEARAAPAPPEVDAAKPQAKAERSLTEAAHAKGPAVISEDVPLSSARRVPGSGRWLLPLVLLGVLLLAGTASLATFSVRSPPPPPPARDPLAAARAVIAQLHLPEVTASMVGKRLVVVGYAATNGETEALVSALRQQGIEADMRVTSEAALVDNAMIVLKAYGLDATVKAAGPGRITLAGYTDDTARLEDVMRRLQTDVVGLHVVLDQVVTFQRAKESLEQALSAGGLGSILRLTTSPHAIKVTGFLDPPGMAQWAPIADRFRADYGAYIRLDSQVVESTGVVPRGVRLGNAPYVVLDDGSRLGIGDMLGRTGRILAVTANGLRLRTASGDVNLPFARAPNWIIMEDKK